MAKVTLEHILTRASASLNRDQEGMEGNSVVRLH
jgi:hypothetical protein